MPYLRFTLFVLSLVVPYALVGQTAPQQADTLDALKRDALKVYLDCPSCDKDYIRTEITYINYVRERKEAQVHILVTIQSTASRGREYTFAFIGQLEFSGRNDTLRYVSRQQDTADIIRAGIVRTLKRGLMYYVAKTPLADQIEISFKQTVKPTDVIDKWDSWVFRVNSSGYLSGEEFSNWGYLNGSLSAQRITEESKIRMSLSQNYNESNFTYAIPSASDPEKDSTITITSITRSQYASALFVKSISEHWSAGVAIDANSSTYNNIDLSMKILPAIEYNLFPYSESTRRELRFLYRIGAENVQYVDTTLYDKLQETLFNESLSISFKIKEKWGDINSTLTASNYLHDFGLKRVSLWGKVNLQLFRGLSLSLYGSISGISDQISLPRDDPSAIDILLQQKERKTNYRFSTSIGISYTFGSIYSNVVNPRFGY